MDNELNITLITLDGYVEVDKFRYVYFAVIFVIFILIICSNSVIVYVICMHQNLYEPMYIFIAALLINSVLLSTAVYPKLLIDFLSEKQVISHFACLFQFHIFYSLGGSEFLLLSVMAYDRYVSICRPLQYAAIMTKTTVSIFLVLAWILPACQMVVPVELIAKQKLCSFSLKGIFCNNNVYKLQCVVPRRQIIHDLFILINIALLPTLFIFFTYTKILIISYRSSRAVRRKAAQTCLPHLIVLINFSCLCMYDVITVRLEADFPKTVELIMTLQIVIYHPLFNPIMYGVKMKEIFKHVKMLFCPTKTICCINKCTDLSF